MKPKRNNIRIILFLLILLSSVIFSCTKMIGDKFVVLSHKQTICADSWPMAINDSLTLLNVANYLNSLPLFYYALSIKLENSPDLCTACTCKTGKTIYVTTFEYLKSSYQIVGFQ